MSLPVCFFLVQDEPYKHTCPFTQKPARTKPKQKPQGLKQKLNIFINISTNKVKQAQRKSSLRLQLPRWYHLLKVNIS